MDKKCDECDDKGLRGDCDTTSRWFCKCPFGEAKFKEAMAAGEQGELAS